MHGHNNVTDTVPVIFDAAEIVNPPLEDNAFFIMTHNIVTQMQKLDRCPGVSFDKNLISATRW